MDLKIITIQHKKYFIPSDDIYYPVYVGNQNSTDNTGINISSKNRYYCELTALFWAWKNLQFDYLGLCHYRRYFIKSKFHFFLNKTNSILSRDYFENILKHYDIILPIKERFLLDTVRSQFIREHGQNELNITEQIIRKIYPEYIDVFIKTLNKHSLYICNMFIANKYIVNKYCTWLFNILFMLETSGIVLQDRIFGFLAERLFNVWLCKENLKIKEVEMINIEQPNYNLFFERY